MLSLPKHLSRTTVIKAWQRCFGKLSMTVFLATVYTYPRKLGLRCWSKHVYCLTLGEQAAQECFDQHRSPSFYRAEQFLGT